MVLSGIFLTSHITMAIAAGKIGVIVVDVQGDFTTWKKGSLAVNGTDKAFVQKVQKATETLSREGYPIFGTQDWHPGDHISFWGKDL